MNTGIRWLPSLGLLLALAAPAAAQSKFELQAAIEPAMARPGETVTLVLQATVADGWHAYGTLEKTNIPVALKADKWKLGGLELAGPAEIPPGERHETAIGDAFPLPNEFTVKQALKVPAGLGAGEVVVAGELAYQICDPNMCLPPATKAFKAKLTVQAAAGAAPAATQDPKPVPGTKPGLKLDAEKLTIVARLDPSPARAGEAVRLVLQCSVDPRYHAYGTKETTNVPVALDGSKVKTGGLELVGEADVPPGERTEKPGLGVTWPLPHEFEVTQLLTVPAGTKPGPVVVEGALDYQVCDENACDPATEAPFRAVLEVEAGEARAAAPTDAGPKTGNGQGPVLRQPKYTLDDVANDNALTGSWWTLILLAIAGGLFALVMPCTYPMIPITFSFFTKQADRLHGKVMSLALAYGLGIVLMFVLVGIAVGDPIVRFAGHWATNLVIGVAFVVFAFSLFGFFTLQLPSFVTNAAGKASATGGLLGVFLMGATLVVSSFTCTAPVVGVLIAGVAEGGHLRVAVGMAVFGLTMAAPFVFLALLPGRVKALPKSGEWMNTLKIALGFVELAAALKFFSNVELTLGWGVLPREVFLMVWAFLFTALALFLFGLLGYREVPVAGVSKARNGCGLLSLGFSFYCLFGVTGFDLDPIMTAFEPPYRLRPVDEHPIVKDDHAAAIALAAREHKYVLVNFTGFT